MDCMLTRCGLEDDQLVIEATQRLVENVPMKILVIEDEVRLAEYLRKGLSEVSVWPSHLDAGARTRRYLRGFSAPTKATHSTRLSAPIIRYFSASVRTAIRSWSPSQP